MSFGDPIIREFSMALLCRLPGFFRFVNSWIQWQVNERELKTSLLIWLGQVCKAISASEFPWIACAHHCGFACTTAQLLSPPLLPSLLPQVFILWAPNKHPIDKFPSQSAVPSQETWLVGTRSLRKQRTWDSGIRSPISQWAWAPHHWWKAKHGQPGTKRQCHC